ncbi:hypothetical protein HHL17_20520 [Chitinophaga sp. G-6-1-13]|uniref:Uncharacterized protein n=1 Tax=Chitinophaga fulva TaxID=2728842 RepID=A0A848GMF9_9BACT|nr:hypothetical protein [Chitinophaga fulva]NML39596.1 hypothetical protein [Chitinophaga fulva]
MTTLALRKEIVQTKKIIGTELSRLQQAFYDEDMLQCYKDDNEEDLYREQFDFFEITAIEYASFNKIIGLGHFDINTFTALLSHKLKELFTIIGAQELIIISHLKLDFFGNNNNGFKPLVNAYSLLERTVGKRTYKEAFMVDLDNLPEFIEILFWITRCDPTAPEYIFLFDKDEKVQLLLCKYGNIHLTEFGSEVLTASMLASLGWEIIEGAEFDNFTDDGKISGRKSNM